MSKLILEVRSKADNRYLAVGISNYRDKLPEFWEEPILPNAYGSLNGESVVLHYLQDELALKEVRIISIDYESGAVKAEVKDDKLANPVIQVAENDPNDEFVHRVFISKEKFILHEDRTNEK